MPALTSRVLFVGQHTGPEAVDDPNLYSADDFAAYLTNSTSISAVTSQIVSRAASGALDSAPVSTADSKGVSSGTRASIADSRAISGSTNTSVADSKASSVSVNTSIADSKATSVGFATIVPALNGIPGFQQPFSTAVLRTANGKMADVLSAKDFGATGNGVTYDTTSLVDAVAAAVALGGGIILLPPGAYLLHPAVLTYSDNVRFVGYGDATIVRLATGSSESVRTIFAPSASGVTGAGFSNLLLDQRGDSYGNNGASPALSINGTIGTLIENVTVINAQTMAVWCDSTSTAPTKKARIRNLWVKNSEAGAISLFGTMEDIQVVGGTFENCKDDPMAYQASGNGRPANVLVTGATFRDNHRRLASSTPHAVLLMGCNGAVATNLTIDGTCAAAIEATDVTVDVSGVPTVMPSEGIVIGQCSIRNAGITPDSTSGVPGAAVQIRNTTRFTVSDVQAYNTRGAIVLATGSSRGHIHHVDGEVCTNEGFSFGQLTDVAIDHCSATDVGTSANGYGMLFDSVAPSTRVSVDRFKAIDTRAGGSRTGAYAVYVTTGSLTASDLTKIEQQNLTTGVYGADAPLSVREFEGTGSPEGSVVGPIGARYRRTDGGAGTCLYVKESNGTAATGWVAK